MIVVTGAAGFIASCLVSVFALCPAGGQRQHAARVRGQGQGAAQAVFYHHRSRLPGLGLATRQQDKGQKQKQEAHGAKVGPMPNDQTRRFTFTPYQIRPL